MEHGLFGKGSARKNHKYYQRVEVGTDRNGNTEYYYFYSKEAYDNYRRSRAISRGEDPDPRPTERVGQAEDSERQSPPYRGIPSGKAPERAWCVGGHRGVRGQGRQAEAAQEVHLGRRGDETAEQHVPKKAGRGRDWQGKESPHESR